MTLSMLVLFAALTIAFFAFGAAFVVPGSPLQSRLQVLLGRRVTRETNLRDRVDQVMEPISKMLPKSPDEVSQSRALLYQAGYREPRHMTVYFGLRVLGAIGGLALVVFTGAGSTSPILMFVVPLIGYVLPRFLLKRKISNRQHSIKLALPDALDLAVICVEAGLSLDQTILRVGTELKHVHPALSDEFQLVNLEMRAGKPRPEALRNLALRTGVDDLRSLVAVLVQTDRFGTSIAHALRVHSDALRTERRQRAEEAAAKTTIKMIPVIVFFIFPAMFFVVLGPAVIQIIRTLLPVLSQ